MTHIRSSGRRRLLLAALAAVVAVSAPASAAQPEDRPAGTVSPAGGGPDQPGPPPEQFFVLGFHQVPPGLARGHDIHGAKVDRVDRTLRFARVTTRSPRQFQERARSDGRTRYLEPDPFLQLLEATPNDPRYSSQYGPQRVRAPQAWEKTMGNGNASVCVVDTGVRYTHEDIAGPRWLGGYDYVNKDGYPSDDNGHGTHVTGIAAASVNNGKGVAGMGNVGAYGVKVLDRRGVGLWSDVASALAWCADRPGKMVINMSLGATSGATVLLDGVRYAADRGALMVAAAGNEGCGDCVHYPAKYPEVVAVACTTSNDSRCSFSNGGAESELAAPGYSVLSLGYSSSRSYSYMSGTSMSTPHVAGAAALVWSQQTSLSSAQLRQRLQGSARDLGVGGWDTTFGYGLLDVDAAMGPSAPPPPPGNQPPVAKAGPDRTVPDADGSGAEMVVLDGSGSSDPDGDTLSYRWTEGADVVGTVARPTVNLAVGAHTIVLRVADPAGAWNEDAVVMTVEANRPPTARFTSSVSGLTVSVDGTGSSDPDGSISYAWDWGDGSSGSGAKTSHTYAAPGNYTVKLTVTDQGGLTGTAEKDVTVSSTSTASGASIDENFDDGETDGWTVTGLWHVSSACGGLKSGNYLAYNKDSDCTYSTGSRTTGSASFDVDLTGRTAATLTFDHRFETEYYPYYPLDQMKVQVSSNNGSTWTTLEQWDSRNTKQPTWSPRTVDLSPFAGQGVRVRFFFDSLVSSNNNYPGWFLDNVKVTSSP